MPDETRETLRQYVQAAREEVEPAPGECPGNAAWIDYHRKRLSPEEYERLQSHLVRCPACRETLLDVADFADPGEDPPADIDREWGALRERISPRRRASAPAWQWAAAAGVILTAGLTTTWIWRLQNTLNAERTALVRLEEQLRELRRQTLVARADNPQTNLRLFDVFPAGTETRSRAEGALTRVTVPPTAPFALILSGGGLPRLPPYGVVLKEASGRVIWESDSVPRDDRGNFVLTFPAGFATEGEYDLDVFGTSGSNRRRLARYSISIGFSPGRPDH
jgi:hypothetical protein